MGTRGAIFIALMSGALGLVGLPTSSHAASLVFNQTSDHCSGAAALVCQ